MSMLSNFSYKTVAGVIKGASNGTGAAWSTQY